MSNMVLQMASAGIRSLYLDQGKSWEYGFRDVIKNVRNVSALNFSLTKADKRLRLLVFWNDIIWKNQTGWL